MSLTITSREAFLESYNDFKNYQIDLIIFLIEVKIEEEKKNNFQSDNITVDLPDEIGDTPLNLKIVDEVVHFYAFSGGWDVEFVVDNGVQIVLYPHGREKEGAKIDN